MISDNNIIKEVMSMGYRRIGEGFYAKPFGRSILVFNTEELKVKQMFKDLHGDMDVWDSKLFTNDESTLDGGLVEFLTYFEEWFVRGKKACGAIHQFLTPQQEVELCYDPH